MSPAPSAAEWSGRRNERTAAAIATPGSPQQSRTSIRAVISDAVCRSNLGRRTIGQAARDRMEARSDLGARERRWRSPNGITGLPAVERPGTLERAAAPARHPGCTDARHARLHHRKGRRPSSVYNRAVVGTGLLSPVPQGSDLWPPLHVPRSPLRTVSGGREIRDVDSCSRPGPCLPHAWIAPHAAR